MNEPKKRFGKPRFRSVYFFGGSIAVILALILTDPDHDLVRTGMILLGLAVCVLAITFSHQALKAVFDYSEADKRSLFAKAREHAIGAGLALISLAIVFHGLLSLFQAALFSLGGPK